MNVILKPAAEADIDARIDYLLEEYAFDAADRFPAAFGEVIELIRMNPEAGAPFLAFRARVLPGFPNLRTNVRINNTGVNRYNVPVTIDPFW